MGLKRVGCAVMIAGVLVGCAPETPLRPESIFMPSLSATAAADKERAEGAAASGRVVVHGSGYTVLAPTNWRDASAKYRREYPAAKFDLYLHSPARPEDGKSDVISVTVEDSTTCSDLICNAVQRAGGWTEDVLSEVERRHPELSGSSVTAVRVRARTQVDGEPAVWLSKDSPDAAIEQLVTFHDGQIVIPTLKFATDSSPQERDEAVGEFVDGLVWNSQ